MDRRDIADLAPLVLDVASADDAVARAVIDGAAGELSEMTAALCEQPRLTSNGFDLAMSGGILCGRPIVRDRVTTHLRDRGWQPRAVEIVADPVRGALRLARE
jgi:N-acetylglucosamine kinase-like BadF-type ATPase